MPATPARIGFIMQPFRRAVAENAAVKGEFGSLARETDDPVETWFSEVDDAELAAEARQALMGGKRRRFEVSVASADELLALDYSSAVPVGRYVDRERDCDRAVLLGDITIDLGREAGSVVVWG